KREHHSTLAQKMLVASAIISATCIIGLAVYYGIGWVKAYSGEWALTIVSAFIFTSYILLIRYSARFPQLEQDDPNDPLLTLPEVGPTVKVGLYFLLPIVVLMWCLVVERFSPGLSAFWATLFMIFIVITQRPLQAYFRQQRWQSEIVTGLNECISGLSHGARNMIGIGVATAAAGIVVGTITLTGIGQVMIGFVEFISGGNLLLALIFTAIICIILGMGLPTTANYIVVSSLMAPVVVSLAATNGMIVPLIAVHMFVFYFGILADDTPPVGLAAFAAAAIANSDPIKTGIQGFMYDIRTAILPFLFIFNTQLLLIGINGVVELVVVIIGAVIAMLLFAAATQGYWLVRSRIWESLALLLIAFTLFRPGFWWDEFYPPLEQVPSTQLIAHSDTLAEGDTLQMRVSGENLDGKMVSKTVLLALGEGGNGEERLASAGIELLQVGEQLLIDNVIFGSAAESAGLDFDWEIHYFEVESQRPPKQWMFLPALLLLAYIGQRQLQRKQPEETRDV
ncbi:MAG: TRAP transporter permease, partial [Gammaproteobacteria bacterium]|nr:TRAP transporter permease [Gammaproteobacteria bacterium]